MKEIVIISGKGGTGKTSITASFAYLGGKDLVVADCDVDAADMHLLLKPDFAQAEDFYSGELAKINQEKCTKCGKCADVCRFDAIPVINGKFIVQDLDCEGCGYCARICPENAISMEENNVGEWIISEIKTHTKMVHASMGIGAENSGKLVAKVKNEAKRIAKEEGKYYVLIDGSPGIGCPVVSSITGADFVVLVTEPTVSGLHDLKRVFEIVEKFDISAGCIINKFDLNEDKTEEIKRFLSEKEIMHIANLPYDETFTKAMTIGKTIVEYSDNNLTKTISQSWEKIKQKLN
ncbi:MAG: ATP-binding protein [Candidatus Cloacimonadota bacterium]|nr:ATP-binding protein [Candidatus Cloacimonadota bacterium]